MSENRAYHKLYRVSNVSNFPSFSEDDIIARQTDTKISRRAQDLDMLKKYDAGDNTNFFWKLRILAEKHKN